MKVYVFAACMECVCSESIKVYLSKNVCFTYFVKYL